MKFFVLLFTIVIGLGAAIDLTHASDVRTQLLGTAKTQPVVVIVSLKDARWPKTREEDAEVIVHNMALIEQFIKSLPDGSYRSVSKFYVTGGFALTVNELGLKFLYESPMVSGVSEDILLQPQLNNAKTSINYQAVIDAGVTGAGSTIAIIDSGINHNNTLVRGRIIDGACFSSDQGFDIPACPNGRTFQEGRTAGQPVCIGVGCEHGQIMANIAAGNYSSSAYDGIATQANIISVSVFHERILDNCRGIACYSSRLSSVFRALNWLYFSHRNRLSVVNISLGTINAYGTCNDQSNSSLSEDTANLITALRNYGIPVVVASGNQERRGNISFPACLSQSTAVAATYNNGVIWERSDLSGAVDLFAPGGTQLRTIYPSYNIGGGAGTSASAAFMSGAFALIKQYNPSISSVDQFELIVRENGTNVSTPYGNRKRLNFQGMFGSSSPQPVPTAPINVTTNGLLSGAYGYQFGTNQHGHGLAINLKLFNDVPARLNLSRLIQPNSFNVGRYKHEMWFQAYDIDYNGEVEVWINNQFLVNLSITGNGVIGNHYIYFYSELSENKIEFRVRKPNFSIWGVRNFTFKSTPLDNQPPPEGPEVTLQLGVKNADRYGREFYGANQHYRKLIVNFQKPNHDIRFSVKGWDIDVADESRVYLNGALIGYQNQSPCSSCYNSGSIFIFRKDAMTSGTNKISFLQKVPTSSWNGLQDEKWGVTDLLIDRYTSITPILQLLLLDE